MRYRRMILALTACALLLWGCGEEERPEPDEHIEEEAKTRPEQSQEPEEKNSSEKVDRDRAEDMDTEPWRSAYSNYLEMMGGKGEELLYDVTFSLIYVDDDEIPELVCDSGVEAGGCQILTYHDGKIDILQTNRLYFDYLERDGLLCNSEGNMGY